MTQFPMRRELQPSTKHVGRRIKVAETVWSRLVNPDFIVIVIFCAIGLLLTINVILRFPELGALIERYNQF